ncbi:FAD-binding domain-containing protein [Hypoxylon trugodes]|uniref:FAD-binding domain-containing protein n=1 Tax=Hypoxylon trugodes TaxID=326681 RepID=UPI0021998543|nr:FAD-binding domain-containing protein [Hypoxylon trugodes]KAI1391408.1 FAD-binding domain-containing protein [Hypoxylon trugodes]
MSSLRKAVVATLLVHVLHFVRAETILVNNVIVPADESTIAPAVAKVGAQESNATADLFEGETLQLTDAVLANLTNLQLSNVTLFSFPDNSTTTEALAKRTSLGGCKTYPTDPYWPFPTTWALLNFLLGGALIQTVPYAASCYDSFGNYNATKCAFITNNWINASIYHTEDPTSVNAVLFQGATCMPPGFVPSGGNCTLGGYPVYAVDVRNVAQIQLALNFARNLNLRVVIKNTGHDFSAKSVGMGALSLWTHNLKQIQFFQNYRQGRYRGPALKLGAGVQAFEAYEAARNNNVTVVGGEGRTVGVAGGYILGGGHSPLSSIYGMGADQVLSMEVVLADGRFVTASENSYPDLFWALRGGGGSTFGVVTSVVVKAYPKIKVTTMTYAFATGPTVSINQFWDALRAYFEGFIIYTEAGNYEYFRISKVAEGQYATDMGPWFAPNMTKAELETLVAPLLARFKEIGVEVNPVYTEYDDYYDAWYASFPVEPWGSNAIRQASRLFPKANWQNPSKLNATFDVIKNVVEEGAYIVAFNIAAAPKTGYPDNAVNPAWRTTVLHAIMATLWNETSTEAQAKAASDRLTYGWSQRWADVAAPYPGVYMSEADYLTNSFTKEFWGNNYPRLYRIKQRYDGFGVFYAHTAVGSEDWKMSEMILGNLPSQNSKLCRV